MSPLPPRNLNEGRSQRVLRPGADIFALGAVFAVSSCGGPIIRYRGGRVDALSADDPGVPLPQQDLATHTQMFQRQGFSPQDMIGLIACGHTIGGVRSSDHPDIVSPGADPSVDVFEMFDDTPSKFDTSVYVLPRLPC